MLLNRFISLKIIADISRPLFIESEALSLANLLGEGLGVVWGLFLLASRVLRSLFIIAIRRPLFILVNVFLPLG